LKLTSELCFATAPAVPRVTPNTCQNFTRVFGVGNNQFGVFGDGTTTNKYLPVEINVTATQETMFMQITGGSFVTVLRASSGKLYRLGSCHFTNKFSWGDNSFGELGIGNQSPRTGVAAVGAPLSTKTVTTVKCGERHCLALTSANEVYAWGYNGNQQIGDGSSTTRPSPVLVSVPFTTAPFSVEAGPYCSYGIGTAGDMYGWCTNIYGEVGDGTVSARATPTATMLTNLGSKRIQKLIAHWACCILTADGYIYCWGSGFPSTPTAVNLTNLVTKTAVDISVTHTLSASDAPQPSLLVVCSDGSVYTLGYNPSYRAGLTTTATELTLVSYFSDSLAQNETVVNVLMKESHSLLTTSTGRVYGWGNNQYGQLGISVTSSSTQSLVQIHTGNTANEAPVFAQFGDGMFFYGTCGVNKVTMLPMTPQNNSNACNATKIYGTGINSYQMLGDGTTVDKYLPTEVNITIMGNNPAIVELAGGAYIAAARTATGQLYTWGDNTNGAYGRGNLMSSTTPVAVNMSGALLGKQVTSLKCGFRFCMVLTSDNSIIAWGQNNYYQLADGTTTDRSLPVFSNKGAITTKTISYIEAGAYSSYAITSDGVPYGWGYNYNYERMLHN
jgi:alpha-tubulin suppressor-like RCC1 family protein